VVVLRYNEGIGSVHTVAWNWPLVLVGLSIGNKSMNIIISLITDDKLYDWCESHSWVIFIWIVVCISAAMIGSSKS